MTSLPFRFAWFRALLALMLLTATGLGAGKGIVIYKDQTWLGDEFAQAAEYEQLDEFTNVYNLTTEQKEMLSILSSKIVKHIRYLEHESLMEIIEPRDIDRVSASISELSKAAHQYPKTSKILEPRIRQLQEIVDRFHKGEVIMDGAWLPSKDAAIKLKKEREAAIAAADAEDQKQAEALRIAKEKRAAEERAKRLEQMQLQQKDILRRQEEAKAAEEQRKLAEESQAMETRRKEEERRAAAEEQALEEKRVEYASRKMREVDRFTEELDRPVSVEPVAPAKLPESHQ